MASKIHASSIQHSGKFLGRKKLLLLVLVPFIFALAFASAFSLFGVSRDNFSYEFFFSELKPSNPTAFVRFEPGFVFSAFIAKFIFFLKFEWYVCTILFIALLIKLRVFFQTYYPFLTLIFYMANWYPLHEYTQIRVAIATSLLFLAFDHFFKGRKLWSAFMCLLAVSFHGSAFFAIAVVSLAYSLSSVRLLLSVPVIAAVGLTTPFFITGFLLPVIQTINPLTENYLLNSDEFSAPTIFSGANILTITFLYLFSVGTGLKQQRHKVIFLTALVSLSVFIAFRDNPVFAQRFREIGLVFITLIAFDYKITWHTVPQALVAIGLSIWLVYSAIMEGIILEGLL